MIWLTDFSPSLKLLLVEFYNTFGLELDDDTEYSKICHIILVFHIVYKLTQTSCKESYSTIKTTKVDNNLWLINRKCDHRQKYISNIFPGSLAYTSPPTTEMLTSGSRTQGRHPEGRTMTWTPLIWAKLGLCTSHRYTVQWTEFIELSQTFVAIITIYCRLGRTELYDLSTIKSTARVA